MCSLSIEKLEHLPIITHNKKEEIKIYSSGNWPYT
jgi:hypothetical protein